MLIAIGAAMGKSKEEMLREEARFYLDQTQKIMQWGVTVMVSLQTALFFLRHELLDSAIAAGTLQKGQSLPWGRHLIGTAFLTFAAAIVSAFSRRAAEQYRHYKKQLLAASESGISDQVTRGTNQWIIYLYFGFPALDILIRLYVTISISIH